MNSEASIAPALPETRQAHVFHFGIGQIKARGRLTRLQHRRSAFSLNGHELIVAKYRRRQYRALQRENSGGIAHGAAPRGPTAGNWNQHVIIE